VKVQAPLARLDAARSAALAAGRVLLEGREAGVTVESKGLNDNVTDVDRRVETFISDFLGARFPGDAYLGEEHGGQSRGAAGAAGRWIVDPIDGTQNFVRGIPDFVVSLAYEDPRRVLQVGVVYNPVRDELFAAVRGHGATLNGRPIRVSQTARPEEAITIVAAPLRRHERAPAYFEALAHVFVRTFDIRRFGAGAQDLCYVARGRADAYFELGLKEWDIAGGMVILAEAGGRCRGVRDGEDPLATGNLLATNGLLED
jgi:myo-inositol-1(or 4)-monophosphatase